MRDLLIGVDAGTSVIKPVAFDLAGEVVALASTPNRYRVGAASAVTPSRDDTWEDCARTLRERVAKFAGAHVVGVGVTAPTVRRLCAQPADAARFHKTGAALNVCQQGAQLAHMLAQEPERLAGAEVALHAKDWLYLKLTDARVTDSSEASFTFGDFRNRAYDDDVIAALGLSAQRRLLPVILDGTTDALPLTARAAAETGLPAATPISRGYIDIVCTALGAGIVTRGAPARCTAPGSTGVHMRAARAQDAVLSEERSGWTIPLPIPGFVAQAQSSMAATLNIDWALSLAADLMADMYAPIARGGLRYLEYCEFRLVREALIEREMLLKAAPHIIWPMRFVLPHSPLDRPACFSATIWAAASCCRRPARSTWRAHPKARRSSPNIARVSSIPIAGWTTRVWSFSTRSTRSTRKSAA